MIACFAALPLTFVSCGDSSTDPGAASGDAADASANESAFPETIGGKLDLIAAEDVTLEQLLRAEQELINADPHEVLPLLLERRLSVSIGHWNGTGNAAGDLSLMPAQPRAAYAYSRVWQAILNREREALSPLLIQLLEQAETNNAQALLINDLRLNWVDAAEQPVADILLAGESQTAAWWSAARCLQENRPGVYGDALRAVMLAMPTATTQERIRKSKLLMLMMQPRHLALFRGDSDVPPVDPLLLTHAFECTQQMHDDGGSGGYFLALQLADYLGEVFKADQSDPRYRENGGLNDAFFIDTVRKALQWWNENKQDYRVDDGQSQFEEE